MVRVVSSGPWDVHPRLAALIPEATEIAADYRQVFEFGKFAVTMRLYMRSNPKYSSDIGTEDEPEIPKPEAITGNWSRSPLHICVREGWGRREDPD